MCARVCVCARYGSVCVGCVFVAPQAFHREFGRLQAHAAALKADLVKEISDRNGAEAALADANKRTCVSRVSLLCDGR